MPGVSYSGADVSIDSATHFLLLSHSADFFFFQPINMFINSADELYGPITTVQNDGQAKQISWTNFTLSMRAWERVHDTWSVISVSSFHDN